jgi:hypothetical protein
VSIAKSVSIVAQGVVAGIQVTSSSAITVSAGSSDVVVLRGLTLDGLNSAYPGIDFLSDGGELHIEDCTLNEFHAGIVVVPNGSSKVFIKDTIVRNNQQDGIVFTPSGSATTVTASLDNVRAENNGNNGVFAAANATVSVRNSVAAGNDTGFAAGNSSPSAPAVMNLESSMASGNRDGVAAFSSATSTVNITNVTVVKNKTGLFAAEGGHIVSFGNNKITDNTTNGSPTQTISQK